MTDHEKTILLIVFIPFAAATVAFIIHSINVLRHRHRAKQANAAINKNGR